MRRRRILVLRKKMGVVEKKVDRASPKKFNLSLFLILKISNYTVRESNFLGQGFGHCAWVVGMVVAIKRAGAKQFGSR